MTSTIKRLTNEDDVAKWYKSCVIRQRNLRASAETWRSADRDRLLTVAKENKEEEEDEKVKKERDQAKKYVEDRKKAQEWIETIESFCEKARSSGIDMNRMFKRGLMDGLEAFKQFCQEARVYFGLPASGSSK